MEVIVGIVLLVLLIAFWKELLAIVVIVGIGFALYAMSKAAEKRQQEEAEKRAEENRLRAEEARKMADQLLEDVQHIAGRIQPPNWDHQQGDKALSIIFSGCADSSILLGELKAGSFTNE